MSKDGSMVRYVGAVRCASVFAKKYSTLVRYAFFVMVRVRYVSKIELKYGTLVRYGSRCEVRSTQILNVPYRSAILAYKAEAYYLPQKRAPLFAFSIKLVLIRNKCYQCKLVCTGMISGFAKNGDTRDGFL